MNILKRKDGVEMDVKKDVKKFIVTKLMQGKNGNALRDDESLFEAGIIDSLGVLQLVSFMEEKCNVVVEDEELIPENFETINKLVDFIEKKLFSGQSQGIKH